MFLAIFVRGGLEQARDKTSSRDDNILSWYGILYGQELLKWSWYSSFIFKLVDDLILNALCVLLS